MVLGRWHIPKDNAMKSKAVAFDVYDTLARWPDSRVQPIEVQRLLARFGVNISYQAFEAARQAVFFFTCPKREIQGWTDFLALVFDYMGAAVSLDLLASLTAMYEARNNMNTAHITRSDQNCDGAANGKDIQGFVIAFLAP